MGADIDPKTFQTFAGHLPFSHGLAQQWRKLERPCRAAIEQLWMQHGDTAVGQGGGVRLTVPDLVTGQAEVAGEVMGGLSASTRCASPAMG